MQSFVLEQPIVLLITMVGWFGLFPESKIDGSCDRTVFWFLRLHPAEFQPVKEPTVPHATLHSKTVLCHLAEYSPAKWTVVQG